MLRLQQATLALSLAAATFALASCSQSPVPSAHASEAGADSAPADPLRDTARQFFQPIPATVNEIRGVAITDAQIDLGRSLFFEPRLSRSQVISCNSCHNLGTGGADNVPTSIGHGWQKGPRNSPTVFNAVFNVAQFWDGRAADLMEQAKGPVQAAVEMNNTPERVEATLRSIPGYVSAFTQAFPEESQPVTFDNMARAIEAFEATLVTPDSRFDQFLAGKGSLDAQERTGLQLFIDKGCVACHSGVNLGGQAYFAFGAVQRPHANILPPADKGRAALTRSSTDEYVFRAAPLRNVGLTAPYFHSGQVWDLREAVAVMGASQLGHAMAEAETDAIARFLRTLDGRPPRVEYPILPLGTDQTPRPE